MITLYSSSGRAYEQAYKARNQYTGAILRNEIHFKKRKTKKDMKDM
jgi:hypothetical protein